MKLKDVVDILKKRVPGTNIDVIKQLNLNTSTHLLLNQELSEEIPTPSVNIQGDSLSPQLFNLIMNEIISHVKLAGRGYMLTTGEIKIICYEDDAVIIAENEGETLARVSSESYRI